jgi:DNA-binding winged helix-turn-helix (wHTH) protein/TolB-like protein
VTKSSLLPNCVYGFGLFQLDPDGRVLLRQGVPVKLQEQPFRVLCLLVEHAGEIITREEIQQVLWPDGTYVEFEGSLNATLKRLRSALGDPADNPIFIETIPKRGYRFIAPVESLPARSAQDPEFTVVRGAARSPLRAISKHAWYVTVTVAVLVLGLAAFFHWYRSTTVRFVEAQHPPVVAVLPFRNEQASPGLEFLRFAIPEDIVTDLTYSRSLSVRPFATTSKYEGQAVDAQAVGRDLKVTHLVSGEFLQEKQNLRITLGLIEVASDRVLWQKAITVGSNDLIGLHKQLADLVQGEVVAALGTAPPFLAKVPTPNNPRAFDIYLRTVGFSRDPAPNKFAIKDLEEAVALDSSYAPAWTELGWRYYIDGHYADGGPTAIAKAEQANQRAIELDPYGTTNLITLKTERGDLNAAYDEARSLLQRRPDSSVTHYEMSYVLRYAGLLEEAGQECDRGLHIDPGYFLFRSCAYVFYLSGNYQRTGDYIRVDEGSSFGIKSKVNVALRQKQYPEAAILAAKITGAGFPWEELITARLAGRPDSELAVIASKLEEVFKVSRDSEDMYEAATALNFAGQYEPAVRLLRMAIAHHYCSYPAMLNDPLLETVRQRPEFEELRQAGMNCQQDFLAHRREVTAQSGTQPSNN